MKSLDFCHAGWRQLSFFNWLKSCHISHSEIYILLFFKNDVCIFLSLHNEHVNLQFSSTYYVFILNSLPLIPIFFSFILAPSSPLLLSTGTSGNPDGALTLKSWCPPWAPRSVQPFQALTSILYSHLIKWFSMYFLSEEWSLLPRLTIRPICLVLIQELI